MSRLRIQHRTAYSYTRPVSFGRHRLVLRPREGHDVRVESMELRITPAYHLAWTRDVFGNSVAIVDFLEAADQLEIESDVVLLRTTPFPANPPRQPWTVPYPVIYDALETAVVSAYQAFSYSDDCDAVRDWLSQDFSAPTWGNDAEGYVFALGRRVHEAIKYQRRAEKGVQTPADTLRFGAGSCRDLATLMMDAARLLGFAARFASGYLDCPASEAGRAAMHAWTEIYFPELGWRGYDPTLGEPTSLKHVTAGVSNHPRGVMPVSGMFSGASSDYREMTAQVKIDKLPS